MVNKTLDMISEIELTIGYIDTMAFDSLIPEYFDNKDYQESRYYTNKAGLQYSILKQYIAKLDEDVRKLRKYVHTAKQCRQ